MFSKLMNDAILAEQWKKTGNLMDLLNDEAWVQEADAEGAEDVGMVEAGLALKPYVELIENTSPEALQRQRWDVAAQTMANDILQIGES
jgi:hypothetical protein